jgi:hypothetical protein
LLVALNERDGWTDVEWVASVLLFVLRLAEREGMKWWSECCLGSLGRKVRKKRM